MSAYVVSDKTISAIVQGMKQNYFPTVINGYSASSNPEEIGQFLLNQNYESVNYRYGEKTEPHQFVMKYKTDEQGHCEDYTLGEIYGCVDCYMYQSCETPGWEESSIYSALVSLKDDLVEKMLDKLGDKAPWGM